MDTTHLKHIGGMIGKMREYRKTTIEELAEQIGVSEQFLIQVENGDIAITIDQLVSIASKLNCYLDINFTPV